MPLHKKNHMNRSNFKERKAAPGKSRLISSGKAGRAKYLIAAFMITAIVLTFAGCSAYSGNVFDYDKAYLGSEITPEYIFAVSSEYFGTGSENTSSDIENIEKQTEKATAARADTVDKDNEEKIYVYWTDDSLVWHLDSRCEKYASSSFQHDGTLKEARKAGMRHVCEECADTVITEGGNYHDIP